MTKIPFTFKCVLLLMLFSALPALAQKVTLRGIPLSTHLVEGGGFDSPMQFAVVIWDGERKLLVTGASRDRAAMAEVMALIKGEINDGDEEPIVIECSRRTSPSDGGQLRRPTARHEQITSLELEGFRFGGRVWSLNR